jgi:hypothetical protein
VVDDRAAGLELPDDLELISHGVILDRDEANEALGAGSIPRERVGLLRAT